MAAATTRNKITAPVGVKLEGFSDAFKAEAERISPEHSLPHLAVLVLATRATLKVSQMELGRNKRKDNTAIRKGLPTPADSASGTKGHRKSGWFSLIANVEQGGRKTVIPEDFVTYMAGILEVKPEVVAALVAEDTKLAQAAAPAAS